MLHEPGPQHRRGFTSLVFLAAGGLQSGRSCSRRHACEMRPADERMRIVDLHNECVVLLGPVKRAGVAAGIGCVLLLGERRS